MREKILISLFVFLFFSGIFFFFLIPQTKSFDLIGGENICYNCSDCAYAIINMSLHGGTVKLANNIIDNTDYGISGYACLDFFSNDNVIFDCQGHTIDGTDASSKYGAYMNVGAYNNTIQNCIFTDWDEGIRAQWTDYARVINTTISSGNYGIEFYHGNNSNLTDVTTNNNAYGIALTALSINNALNNIIANSNSVDGLLLSQVYNSTFTNITANNNQYGILLQYYGSNNIFRNNILSDNTYNFYIAALAGTTAQDFFNNSIDTSNLIDYSYPIYYNYSISNYVFNPTTAPNAGAIFCAACNNITVRDLNLSHHNYDGLYFFNVTNSTIRNVSADLNYLGIHLIWSSNNLITNINSSGSWPYSIEFENSIGNLINNTNFYGNTGTSVYLSDSNNNTIKNFVSGQATGLYFQHSNDTTVVNSRTSSGTTGIALYYSNNTNLTNIVSNNNSQYGLYVVYSPLGVRINNATLQENNYTDINFGATVISDCSNSNFTNVNGSGGRAIGFYNYNTNIANREFSELIICNVNYFNATNITIRGSNSLLNNGFFGNFINSSNFSRINSSYAYDGIAIYFINNSFITDINVNNNKEYGLYLYKGQNNYLEDIIANNNLYGLDIESMPNSTIKNLNSSYGTGGDGLYIQNSNNFTIINATLNHNGRAGVYISNSVNNTILNSTLNYNNYSLYVSSSTYNLFSNLNMSNSGIAGIQFTTNSNYNVLKNSHITYSTDYGIYLAYVGGKDISYARYNLIYNNFIKNAYNLYNDGGASNVNYLNITNTSGTSIVGGDYIGGNVWAFPNGTGFSQLCTDANSDGFCDESYTPDSGNYDYLPLAGGVSDCVESWTCTAWSVCSGGVQTRACSDLNACGTVLNQPAESQSCGAAGGGGGGETLITTETITSISPSVPTEIIINQPEIDLLKLTLVVTEDIPTASVTITKVQVVSEGGMQIGLPSGESYQAFRIDTTGFTDTNIQNVTIDFKVNKTWLEGVGGTIEELRLYRMPSGATEWSPLSTSFVREDAEYYYFSSVSPGFSTFVIFFGRYECQPGVKRCFNSQSQLCLGNATWLVTEKCPFGCNEKGDCVKVPPQSFIVYTLIIAIVSVGIILTGYITFLKVKKRR